MFVPRLRRALAACLVVMTVGLPTAAAKEPAAPSKLHAALEALRARHDVPALGAALVRIGQKPEIVVTGTRRAGGKTAVTPQDLWHLGSCTKAITATLVARLVERGTLAWEDTLAKRFPRLAPKMHADYRAVTLEQLLANRGGAPASLDARGLWSRLWEAQGTPRAQRMQLVEGVLPYAPAAKPGTTYLYANAGFAIAGAAAEEATNKAWEDLLRDHVFKPLGMQHAGFGPPGTAATEDQPRGHTLQGGKLVPVEPGPRADNPAGIGPAGTVHATLGDWAKFVTAHLRGARGEEQAFLKPTTFQRLHTPAQGQEYALGWMVVDRPWGGGRVLTHSGSNTMWFCTAWIAPKKGFAVLVTCNAATAAATQACDAAVGLLLERVASKPK